MQIAGLPVEDDVSRGVWLSSARRRGERGTVSALVPAVFEAYARVLHPAVRYDGDDDVEVAWREVAAHNGTSLDAVATWDAITRGPVDCQPPVWDDGPSEGHLAVPLAARLSAVLARHTGTPEDCVLGRWDGFGFDTAALDGLPRLLLRGGQDLVLLRGTVTDVTRNLAPEPHEQSANVWWPSDQAWCVVTDVDLRSTYVGGSAACIREILTATGVEALPVTPQDPVAA